MTTSPRRAAAGIAAELSERTHEIEANRTLPEDLVDRLTAAGLFRFWVPRDYGGPEVSALEGLDTITDLAEADAAAAWCVFIANTTALLAAFMQPPWAEKVFGPATAVTGGFAQPVGRARVVDGGLRVSGRWAWGSGTRHCTMIGGGVVLVDDEGRPTPRRGDGLAAVFAFFDPDDVTFIDNWHTLGLGGSGSGDYEVTDAFVPEGRWGDLADRTRFVDGALYRFSFFGLLGACVAATSIGIARRAITEFVDLARVKTPQSSRRTLAERASTQEDVARAEATVASAKAFLDDVVGRSWTDATAGRDIDVELRRLLRLAVTDGTQRCAESVARLYRIAGGEAVYERCLLEKLFRDINVATQHAMAAPRVYEPVGRIRLGLDTDVSTL